MINYKGNMKWYLDNHITWLSNDDINYSKGNMEDELNKGSAWRLSEQEALEMVRSYTFELNKEDLLNDACALGGLGLLNDTSVNYIIKRIFHGI